MTTKIDSSYKVVLIRLTNSYPDFDEGSQKYDAALYDATRMWWKVAASRTVPGPGAPDYAFALHQGKVKAVYSIDSWLRLPDNGRFGFEGSIDRELQTKYRDTDLLDYFPRGAINPIKFVNCAQAAQTAVTVGELEQNVVTDDERRAEIRALVSALETEPLTHIMFGGRELFHSNLLAWFGDHLTDRASDVFDALYREPCDTEGPLQGYVRRTQRERDHLDVCVWWDDHRRPLVIENKVFSLPDVDQLNRYAERISVDVELPEPRQILLSLQDPQWPEDTFDTAESVPNGRAWHRVSYGTLSRLITRALEHEVDRYEITLMRQYAQMIGNLQNVADAVAVRSLSEHVDLLEGLHAAESSNRLTASLSKLRARSVAQLLQSELDRSGAKVVVESGFSNATPVVTGFHKPQPDLANDTTVGWQLQGGDFRLYAILPSLSGKKPEDIEARANWARSNLAYFDFSTVDTYLDSTDVAEKPKSKGTRTDFNRFNPDFVYRSKKVGAVTVGQLLQAAHAYAQSIDTA